MIPKEIKKSCVYKSLKNKKLFQRRVTFDKKTNKQQSRCSLLRMTCEFCSYKCLFPLYFLFIRLLAVKIDLPRDDKIL